MRARVVEAIRTLAPSERGIALPMAMLMTAICLGFAAVPILASINTQEGTTRDQSGNMALAAADAGLNLAMLRQNQASPTTAEPCVSETGGKLVLGAALTTPPSEVGWCTAVTLTASSSPSPPSGTEIIYRVKPCYPAQTSCTGTITTCESTSENLVKVISTGIATVAGRKIERRVSGAACSKQETKTTTTTETTPPPEVFSGSNVIGIESLYLKGNSIIYHGGAASNGTVEIIDSSKICGGLTYGTGTLAPVGRYEQVKNVRPASEQPYSNGTGGGVCNGELPAEGTSEYPAVTAPADIATNNSNSRLAEADQVGSSVYQRGNIAWNPSNRTLEIKYSTLTLGGTAPYFLCGLVLTGGAKLIPAPGANTRIFFDSPANCPGLNGANQLTINGGTTVEPDSANGPGFYFLGSPSGSAASKIYFGNGAATAQMVIYAPYSSVEIAGGINLNGAVLGRTLRILGGANINPLGEYAPPPSTEYLPTTTTTTTTTTSAPKPFARKSYVQCSSTPPSTSPESGC